MTNLDSILKNRDITLLTKVYIVKAMVFPIVVVYGCQRCTIKKAKHQRTDAFELWCWKRLLRVPWTARRSNQSIPKEYSLEGLMLKLKLQYSGHLMQRADSWGKTLMLGKMRAGGERDDGGWDGWMASSAQWTWIWVNSRRWWRTGRPGMLQSMGSQIIRHNLATEQEYHQVIHYLLALKQKYSNKNRIKLQFSVSQIPITYFGGMEVDIQQTCKYVN